MFLRICRTERQKSREGFFVRVATFASTYDLRSPSLSKYHISDLYNPSLVLTDQKDAVDISALWWPVEGLRVWGVLGQRGCEVSLWWHFLLSLKSALGLKFEIQFFWYVLSNFFMAFFKFQVLIEKFSKNNKCVHADIGLY